MASIRIFATILSLGASASAFGQLANQVQLKLDSSSPTISVSAEERVTAEPDIAVLHIGFVTPPSDAKQAYAAGSKASNQIIAALKGAGIDDASIRSESQQLESWDPKAHKFQLKQSWAVKVAPKRVAEILDVAVNAGATESGGIEWNVDDETALEHQALEKAAAHAREDAIVLAKSMNVRLGKLIYSTNQTSVPQESYGYATANFGGAADRRVAASPLAIEPHKVSRTATVYAVFAIE